MQIFIEGKYSQLSVEAKEMIQEHPGLLYREKSLTNDVPFTDVRIPALNRSVALRELWEAHYGVRLDADDELLSVIDSRAFIDMDMLVSVPQSEVHKCSGDEDLVIIEGG